RGPPVHGVAVRSVFLRGLPVHGEVLAFPHPLSHSLAGSGIDILSDGGSRRLSWCSLAGHAQHLVQARSTRCFRDQTHSKEGQSAHLATRHSFPPPPAVVTVFPLQAVAAL